MKILDITFRYEYKLFKNYKTIDAILDGKYSSDFLNVMQTCPSFWETKLSGVMKIEATSYGARWENAAAGCTPKNPRNSSNCRNLIATCSFREDRSCSYPIEDGN